jgi:hypothetical protein
VVGRPVTEKPALEMDHRIDSTAIPLTLHNRK